VPERMAGDLLLNAGLAPVLLHDLLDRPVGETLALVGEEERWARVVAPEGEVEFFRALIARFSKGTCRSLSPLPERIVNSRSVRSTSVTCNFTTSPTRINVWSMRTSRQ
jgi:hypothetical protein